MAKKYLLKINFCSIFLLLSFSSQAQVIILSNANFAGSNFAGPVNTSTSANAASRFAYIFPQSTVSSLVHGDSIRSISFRRNGGGALSGTCNMKIYMRTTVNSNYGLRNVNWVNLTGTTGMRKVYDKDPVSDIGSSDGWVRFVFSTPYVIDTILGRNLEILVEYTQTSSQSASIFWSFENSGSISGYTANQTKFVRTNGGTLTDTTNSSTEWHPSIRIEFPRSDFDISVNKVYSLGKIPVPLGNPDTVKAIVQNVGKKQATFKAYLKSNGANNLIDSATYTLDYLEEKWINLPLIYPTNTGLDTLSAIIQNDSNNNNNSRSVYRLSTTNIYSYKDPTQPIAGGIGFNGSSGDFVARFFSNTPKAINQISVSFAGSNQKFKLGIWKADGPNGTPGTNVWTSDSLQTSPNFITPVLPPVNVDSSFYVGVRQLGTVNVAFGYQPEQPVRPNTFFYASPLGDTNWIDFSPGTPFKFAIEPRLQAVHDLAPVKVIIPKDTVKLNDVVTMAPKATILNYGTADELTPFAVKINIYRYGNLEYTSTRTDTLSSGLRRDISFDSSFLPVAAGDYDIHVITRLSSDQMKDNDTLRSRFVVAVFKDVGPGTIFDPSNGYDYEQFVDTIFPTVFIQNYGLDVQGPFSVRAEIYDSAMNLIYFDAKSFTLTSLNSVLASFKPFPCSQKGTYHFRAFTQLAIDVDKSNDTVRRTFKIVRSNDVIISSITYPANNSSLFPPVASKQPEAILENPGDMNQSDPFWNYCEIFYGGNLIYRDSISLNSFRTIPQTLLFKTFKPTLKGYYNMKVYSSLPTDQFKPNDTAYSTFAVGVPDDIEVIDISPSPLAQLQLDSTYPTSVTLRNNGYLPQSNPFPLIFKVTQGQSIKYVKVKQVSLDSGETKTFIIDTTLVLSDPGSYNVSVFTSLSKDFIRSNDTINTTYEGIKAYDIAVSSIIYPRLSDTLLINTQNVESVVQYVSSGDSASYGTFRATLKILNKANKAVLYNKFIDTSMNGTDSLKLKFPGFTLSNTTMDIIVQSFVDWLPDQYALNDSAVSESKFMLLYDIAAVNTLLPAAGASYLKTAADFLPQIRIKNNALKTLDNVFCRLVIVRVDTVSLAETEVYRDSLVEYNLIGAEVRDVTMLRQFSPAAMDKGVYKAYLSTIHNQDQVFNNNQQVISFRIDEKTSVNELLISGLKVYPIPVSELLYIELKDGDELTLPVRIYDMQGRELIRTNTEGKMTVIDVSNLPAGAYTLLCGNRLIKIIVEK